MVFDMTSVSLTSYAVQPLLVNTAVIYYKSIQVKFKNYSQKLSKYISFLLLL